MSAKKLAQQSATKGLLRRLLARFAGSVSSVLLAQSLILLLVVRLRGGDFRVWEKASKSFWVLVAYTEGQKVLGGSNEPKAMRFAVQPNG
jgi:hypothetical protein